MAGRSNEHYVIDSQQKIEQLLSLNDAAKSHTYQSYTNTFLTEAQFLAASALVSTLSALSALKASRASIGLLLRSGAEREERQKGFDETAEQSARELAILFVRSSVLPVMNHFKQELSPILRNNDSERSKSILLTTPNASSNITPV